MSLRNSIPFFIFITIVLFLWLGLGKDPNLLPSMLLNKPLPHFSAEQLEEKLPQFHSDDLKGPITLLTIWATWCDGCRIEHPIFLDMARQNNIHIIGLNYKDDRKVAKQYLQTMGNPYIATIYDPDGKIGMQLGVYGTPETFIIDKSRIVRFKFIGPVTLDVWQKILSPQIKKIEVGG